MARKRAHDEGTITKRKDGRWEAKASVGYTPEGKPKRQAVYGRTQADVKEKLEALKRRLSDGTYSDCKLTLAQYLESWLKEKERTAMLYREQADRYVIPKLGRVKPDKLRR